jgi:hypothetical protein
MNNKDLFEQIRYHILETYKPQLQRTSEGTLKFFIRNSMVQKCYPTSKIMLLTKQPVTLAHGMSREAMKMFFSLIERALSSQPNMEYGTVTINYQVSPDGNNLEAIELELEREVHFARC